MDGVLRDNIGGGEVLGDGGSLAKGPEKDNG